MTLSLLCGFRGLVELGDGGASACPLGDLGGAPHCDIKDRTACEFQVLVLHSQARQANVGHVTAFKEARVNCSQKPKTHLETEPSDALDACKGAKLRRETLDIFQSMEDRSAGLPGTVERWHSRIERRGVWLARYWFVTGPGRECPDYYRSGGEEEEDSQQEQVPGGNSGSL